MKRSYPQLIPKVIHKNHCLNPQHYAESLKGCGIMLAGLTHAPWMQDSACTKLRHSVFAPLVAPLNAPHVTSYKGLDPPE